MHIQRLCALGCEETQCISRGCVHWGVRRRNAYPEVVCPGASINMMQILKVKRFSTDWSLIPASAVLHHGLAIRTKIAILITIK